MTDIGEARDEEDAPDLLWERYWATALHHGARGRVQGWRDARAWLAERAAEAFAEKMDERAFYLRGLVDEMKAAMAEYERAEREALNAAADAETRHIESLEEEIDG